MAYLLQAKTYTSRGLVWKTAETSENREELKKLIPQGRESRFRIIIKPDYKDRRKKKKELFSKNLLNILKDKGITRTDAIKMCDIQRATMWNYYHALSIPTEGNIEKICKGLGVTKKELLGE